jgi:hypothetical protein
MRSLPSLLLLVLCASTATAGVIPITSFEPDTAWARRRAEADTVSLPVWVGIQVAPVVGDTWVRGQPRMWDTEGTPWLAMSAAWPWTSPHEVWLGVGYERWRYELHAEAVPFPSVLLPLLNPLKLDQATLRTGFDQLIARGHLVSGALGGGVGLGLGFTRIGQLDGTEWSLLGETFARGLLYVRIGDRSRLGAGALGGPTFDFHHGGDPLWHWELEFHVERSVGGSSRPAH